MPKRLSADCARGDTVDTLDITGHSRHLKPRSVPLLLRLGQISFFARFTLWKYALVCRVLAKVIQQTHYDRVVLSFGEGPVLPCPALRVLHAPSVFTGEPVLLGILGARSRTMLFRRIYARICRFVARPEIFPSSKDITIANSRWTASIVQKHFEFSVSGVLYPPVCAPFVSRGTDQDRKSYSMISVGRIVKNKRLEEAVGLLDFLRAEGVPANLHILGRSVGSYTRRFAKQFADHPNLRLSFDVNRAKLNRAFATATIGIHSYRGEHFGIAVAEMISAGVLPLVHDSGGVRELVPCSSLRFGDQADLFSKANALLQTSRSKQLLLLKHLQSAPALAAALDFELRFDAVLDQGVV